ncbi:hypothetical protein COO60DRAFT_144060 [Scenedesmus sp. NREL 46B-D3]|nr:hypothetical protein COO60DRAFT_144060 [Scenedesmus sp. NREL 46B-D3]
MQCKAFEDLAGHSASGHSHSTQSRGAQFWMGQCALGKKKQRVRHPKVRRPACIFMLIHKSNLPVLGSLGRTQACAALLQQQGHLKSMMSELTGMACHTPQPRKVLHNQYSKHSCEAGAELFIGCRGPAPCAWLLLLLPLRRQRVASTTQAHHKLRVPYAASGHKQTHLTAPKCSSGRCSGSGMHALVNPVAAARPSRLQPTSTPAETQQKGHAMLQSHRHRHFLAMAMESSRHTAACTGAVTTTS